MGFGERLKELRESKGMSQKELAKCVDVSDAAIANYENSQNYPKPTVLIRLMAVLECDANYLYQDYILKSNTREISEEEYDIVKKYRKLNKHGKEMVRIVADAEFKCAEEYLMRESMINLNLFIPAFRSNGYVIFQNPKLIKVPATELNSHADFGVKIITNTTKPLLNIGDIALIKRCKVNHNDVGLFQIDGLVHIKKLYSYKGKVKLVPLNVNAQTIVIEPGMNFQTLGKVIGKLEGHFLE